MEMTWEQKFVALNMLAKCSLEMRKPSDWFVGQAIEKKVGDMLEAVFGEGTNPAGAVLDHWLRVTNLKEGEYLVINSMDKENRKAYKWNGFMWEQVDEKRMQELYGK
jgi:hypothetical protein